MVKRVENVPNLNSCTLKSEFNGHSKKTKNGFQDRLSLNAGQKYYIMLQR